MLEKPGEEADEVLRRLLEEERPGAEAEVDEWLVEIMGLDAWLAEAGLPADRRTILERARTERAASLADRLASWRARGGRVRLTEARDDPDVPAVAPPTAERAVIVSRPDDATAWPSSFPPPAPRVPSVVAPDWRGALRALLPSLRSDRLSADEVVDLEALVFGTDRLRAFPKDVQVSLLSYAAARARHLQGRDTMDDARIVPFMSAIRAFAKQERTGFIHGPKQTSGPESNSWEQDARTHLDALYDRALSEDDRTANVGRVIGIIADTIRDAAPLEEVLPLVASAIRIGVSASNTRLVNLTAPFLGQMERMPELKGLRRAIRTAERDALAQTEPEEPAIPPDWPWLAFTQGKRAVMIGGDPREPNRLRIEQAFGFAELAWEGTEFSPRSIDAVRDRVASGGVDFLIILRRFIGHDTDNILLPACTQTGTPWVSVPSGYGISRILQEIERRIPRPVPT